MVDREALYDASLIRDAVRHTLEMLDSWRGLYEQRRLGVPASMRDDGFCRWLVPSVSATNNAEADGDAGGTIVPEQGWVRLRIKSQPTHTLAQVLILPLAGRHECCKKPHHALIRPAKQFISCPIRHGQWNRANHNRLFPSVG